jgi:hypothetical protein
VNVNAVSQDLALLFVANRHNRFTEPTKTMPMTTPIPFDVFSPELLPGETVQWTGRPNAAVIFHKEDWAMIPFSLLWGGFAIFWLLGASGIANFVSATRTPSCKDSRRIAMLRHDQALKEGADEVAKAGFRAGT